MDPSGFRRRRSALAVLAVASVCVVLSAAPAASYHFSTYEGWRDRHVNYPPLPSGYSGIVSVFGEPCNSQVNKNRTNWVASDDGVSYAVYYHRKLGGWGPFYGGTNCSTCSSNLNNDVRGHIRNDHLHGHVKRGIWGYNCRRISGSTKWSTHAWGIAVDINSAYEHVGSDHRHCHSIPSSLAKRWTDHRWVHGVSFGDCMHFQYATNY